MKTFYLSGKNRGIMPAFIVLVIAIFGVHFMTGFLSVYETIAVTFFLAIVVNSYIDVIYLNDNKIIVRNILKIPFSFSYEELFKYDYGSPVKVEPLSSFHSKDMSFLFLKFHFIPLLFAGKAISQDTVVELIDELETNKQQNKNKDAST